MASEPHTAARKGFALLSSLALFGAGVLLGVAFVVSGRFDSLVQDLRSTAPASQPAAINIVAHSGR